MKSDCKNGRFDPSHVNWCSPVFLNYQQYTAWFGFVSFVAANALCSLDVRDHVGRNPSHDVCTKLQLCTRIIGRPFCPQKLI